VVRRADYSPPAFLIDSIDLRIELGRDETNVASRLIVRRNPAAAIQPADLILDGEKLNLVCVRCDGQPAAHKVGAKTLTVRDVPDRFVLDVVTRINPSTNTELTGLYTSGNLFCTHCEPEGFRRITYFLDRPDVMARYTTTIEADRTLAPVLLSNGNLVATGDLAGGRHFATWADPFPKPSYLFAMVAGPLACLQDSFTTRSGRKVALRIYALPSDVERCRHAMASLKKAMKWDEDAYGLECDLDTYAIVAVDDFNMGAMENKGLNIFNSKLLLADPEMATDHDFRAIETVVAHEYFHNWTGNRVTCRDWFQLSLKEGLTVFRDQQFSADMGSAADCRIGQVAHLRASQFPEDAGPMAHPVRPDSYIEINNFYTATVYSKGAEVVRMLHALVGRDGFRRGLALYIERHDGQAVTCEDFVQAMQDASGLELAQFRLWYSQSGTPELAVEGRYDAVSRQYVMTVRQRLPPTPGQSRKRPMHIPLAVGLLDRAGHDLPLRLAGEAAPGGTTRVLGIRRTYETFIFEDVPEQPVASLLRGFSAPIKLVAPRSDDELAFLMAHDSDPFARWEAGQQLAAKTILGMVADRKAGRPLTVPDAFVDAVRRTLDDRSLDLVLIADAVALPDVSYLGELMAQIDIDGLCAARQHVRATLAHVLADRWSAVYEATRSDGACHFTADDVARRRLCGTALYYLAAIGDDAAHRRAIQHFECAAGMTEATTALFVLAELGGAEAEAAFARFYDRWKHQPLVLDKWFSIQAGAPSPAALDRVRHLLDHPAYDRRSPNRVWALMGAFVFGNPEALHRPGHDGYDFLAREVMIMDRINPQLAARLIGHLAPWRRYDADRRSAMRRAIEWIASQDRLSRDVFEIVAKSLA
jgi:aminopeptidase N